MIILFVIDSFCCFVIMIVDFSLVLCYELEFLLRENINEIKLNFLVVCNLS